MRNTLILICSFFFFSGHSLAEKAGTRALFRIDTNKTNVKWTGRKVTGSHWGNIKVKEGHLAFTKANNKIGSLVAGRIVIDMNSIRVLDIEDEGARGNLTAHLKNDDFFATDKYSTAMLDIKQVVAKKAKNTFDVQGNLTIKGITRPISFEATLSGNQTEKKGSAKIRFNRTEYGIKYKSKSFFKDLGDKFIYDDVDIDVSLIANPMKSL